MQIKLATVKAIPSNHNLIRMNNADELCAVWDYLNKSRLVKSYITMNDVQHPIDNAYCINFFSRHKMFDRLIHKKVAEILYDVRNR